MKVLILTFVLFTTLCCTIGGVIDVSSDALKTEFYDLINSQQSLWKAGRNFDQDTPTSVLKGLLGVLPRKSERTLPIKTHVLPADSSIPEEFDARTKEEWAKCSATIGHIRDQSVCGSCWAIAAAEAMTDRICISSNGERKEVVSAGDLMSCCSACGDGCNGGWLEPAWQYWNTHGIATGGDYGTNQGCIAYPFAQCDHHVSGQYQPCGDLQATPACRSVCDDGSAGKTQQLTFGSAYGIKNSEEQIQLEILKYGPVEASFDVYEDFLTYKEGIYKHVAGDFAGGHAVKILGWGVDNGTKYWLIANSWNEDWGEKGLFKYLRGENHLGMEEDINAGWPSVTNF